jgi:hypothetical protein
MSTLSWVVGWVHAVVHGGFRAQSIRNMTGKACVCQVFDRCTLLVALHAVLWPDASVLHLHGVDAGAGGTISQPPCLPCGVISLKCAS